MKPDTFHPFLRLPKELRDMIWDFAIRPERPSAHFFTIFDSSDDTEWNELSELAISHPYPWVKPKLAAPEIVQDAPAPRQFSWVRGNRSAYLMDSGLWSACPESRDALRRRFMKGPAVDLAENCREAYPGGPAIVSFTSDGERWCCLTHQKMDLFLLRPYNATTVDWEWLYHDVSIFDPAGSQRSYTGYVGHIAIDYDPNWQRTQRCASWDSPGTIGFAIRAATDELSWAENLWFVDYRLRRSPGGVQPTAAGRRQFYGNGCRFTEVQDGDEGWELNGEGDEGWESDCPDSLRGIFWFLGQSLWECTREYLDDHYGEGWPLRNPHFYYSDMPNVGLLAYEEED